MVGSTYNVRIVRSSFLLPALFLVVTAVIGALAQESLPELVKRIKPSAVAIETFDRAGKKVARGSGFFIAPDRVVTNRHVIEGAYRAEIHTTRGNTYKAKGVLAVDGEADIALMQVETPPNEAAPLKVVRTSPQEGESVVVIGNPFGLEGSVSNGIVSAVRDIPNFGRIIQITAPISPGSSGSPVVNMQGEVIGVATLQVTEGQSLNFAVPSERIAQLQPRQLTTFADLVDETKRNKRATAERFYMQGLGFLSGDDWAKALPNFEKAVNIAPDYAEAWYQISYCNGMLGRHTEALKASEQVINLKPDWPEPYINSGHAYAHLGQYKKAAEAYKKALRLQPYNADLYYALGLTYGKWGQTEDEIQAYKRAISLKPDYALAYRRLGLAYIRLKRYSDAVGAFKQEIVFRPGDANAYQNLGEAFLKMSKSEGGAEALNQAIEAFKQAIRLQPDFVKAYFNLGTVYLQTGDREAALAQYNILKGLDPAWADELLSKINQ